MSALKEILEGKPVRSPLHPAVAHLPLALLPLSVILDIVSWIVPHAGTLIVRAAFVCLGAGIVTALFAAIFGFVDYTDIRADHPGKRWATLHLVLNLIAVGLFAASAGLRYGALSASRTPVPPLILSILSLLFLSYAGYLGGRLVYDDGIAVGRHRRHTRTPEKTIAITTGGEPAVVTGASELGEGETLRVNVDGTIAAIVRRGDEVYAFQDFCTHRFAPLSEGEFDACEVTCPWHGSRFDIQTGQVKGGPAKVALRIYRTEIRDGNILIYPPAK